ncbi:hypothetical protein HYX12_02415 [Candidatus Woesearchaeota archaeon]|nr:hypothetical protein [Candidatus Woesearchaeota archaeon]
MRFREKKVYGESRIDHCSFCSSIATQKNEQGILVCRHHLQRKIEDIKCTCGSWLEQRTGKFGPYFNCINCGNINFNKGLEMKRLTKIPTIPPSPLKAEKKVIERKEITITSNDPEYFS